MESLVGNLHFYKKLWRTCFPVDSTNFLRTSIFQKICKTTGIYFQRQLLGNSEENTCAGITFKLNKSRACNFIKKDWHKCFPVDFVKVFRIPHLNNTCELLEKKSKVWSHSYLACASQLSSIHIMLLKVIKLLKTRLNLIKQPTDAIV